MNVGPSWWKDSPKASGSVSSPTIIYCFALSLRGFKYSVLFNCRKMVHCCWGQCANDDKYNKESSKRPRQEFISTKWIPWPKNNESVLKWIKACSTENLTTPEQITRSKRICSLHFVGGNGPTEAFPDPVPYFDNSTQKNHWLNTAPKCKPPKERDTSKCNSRKRIRRNESVSIDFEEQSDPQTCTELGSDTSSFKAGPCVLQFQQTQCLCKRGEIYNTKLQKILEINSYSASHDNWCTGTLWNRIMTAQCEGKGEVGLARYEPVLLPPCPSIRVLSYINCQEIHSRQQTGLAV